MALLSSAETRPFSATVQLMSSVRVLIPVRGYHHTQTNLSVQATLFSFLAKCLAHNQWVSVTSFRCIYREFYEDQCKHSTECSHACYNICVATVLGINASIFECPCYVHCCLYTGRKCSLKALEIPMEHLLSGIIILPGMYIHSYVMDKYGLYAQEKGVARGV